MRIGFIGLGNMGEPMAGFVLGARHSLVVHDVRREAAAALLARGAVWADSPRDVAAQCDVIYTCVPGPAEMKTVMLGPGGILEGVERGSVWSITRRMPPPSCERLRPKRLIFSPAAARSGPTHHDSVRFTATGSPKPSPFFGQTKYIECAGSVPSNSIEANWPSIRFTTASVRIPWRSRF